MKEVKRIGPVEGVISTLEVIVSGENKWRKDALRNEDLGHIIIDTCVGFDTHEWETGITQDNEKTWTIVEQYPSYEEVVKGHEKWIKTMKEDPEQELTDINVWDI